jgi:mannose-1-phosphate guanylyltransferase
MIRLLMEISAPDPVGSLLLFLCQASSGYKAIQAIQYASKSMKAFLLAAGEGTRLRPITDKIPKCLVPINGVPMLQIWMDICRDAGIDEVMINLHTHADIVRDWTKNNKNGVRVHLAEEPSLLGSAGTVLANREWVAADPNFWILYADVLTNTSFHRMMEFHVARQPAATLGLYQVPDPSRCGVVSFDEQMVVHDFQEKPVDPKSRWAFSGIMIGTPDLLNEIPVRFPVDLGFDVLPRLAGRMIAYPISDYVLDIGTLANYQAAQRSWPGLALPGAR